MRYNAPRSFIIQSESLWYYNVYITKGTDGVEQTVEADKTKCMEAVSAVILKMAINRVWEMYWPNVRSSSNSFVA